MRWAYISKRFRMSHKFKCVFPGRPGFFITFLAAAGVGYSVATNVKMENMPQLAPWKHSMKMSNFSWWEFSVNLRVFRKPIGQNAWKDLFFCSWGGRIPLLCGFSCRFCRFRKLFQSHQRLQCDESTGNSEACPSMTSRVEGNMINKSWDDWQVLGFHDFGTGLMYS